MFKSRYFDSFASVDYETYYSSEYSLRSKHLTMTDYIRHEEFEVQSVAVRHSSWRKPRVVPGYEARDLLNDIDWSSTAFLGHHTQFDGLITTHHFDIEPVFWLDTLSMSRAISGVDENHGIAVACPRWGIQGKVRGSALVAVKGIRLANMPPAVLKQLMLYNGDDCESTFQLFLKLSKFIPEDELRIIDQTMRMYCEPLLELNEQVLRELHAREVSRRQQAIVTAETDKATLGSSERFAGLLRSLGVIPPTKLSRRTGKMAYAFARTDLEFKELLEHPDERVRAAVEARLRTKSALIENRSERLLNRVGLPTPVYLGYWAARTGRWGGGDKVNLQNLPSRGDGANLRRSISAPEGCVLIIGDAAQIEARMLAWRADFQEKIDAFIAYDQGRGPGIYEVAATGIYGFEVNAEEHPHERFIGKVYELAGGYGAGAVRMRNTLKQGIYGPPVDMPLHEVKANLDRWRKFNWAIIEHWRRNERNATLAFLQGQLVEDGPITFELHRGDGYMHLPNGTFMRYKEVGWDSVNRQMYYNSRNGQAKLWGGIITENEVQALSCCLLKWQMLRLVDELPEFRIANTVHDEVVSVTFKKHAERYREAKQRIMSTGPTWAKGLPLNAKVKVSEIYDKD